ncbi:MAG: GMC family oxidoreductase N-terminal domain-containing protein [Alphaproteobacteria bacterium]|nr:GMC family oxidoreductase N-terminal domain-containing protein [Alphaproteobacteria bacterium]MCW5740752.1 GMC family oxidoreductase N-terminal domain-containing protein [Alphaproteobacteria bacterium]
MTCRVIVVAASSSSAQYDFIVVGAGSAGAAVAHRLSADPRHRVLLLEAGRASHPWTRIPVGSARLITNPAANWLYSAEPEATTNGRRIPVPRGKLLGGSSAINGMAFVRGQAQDFDTWAQMGCRGWAYEDVLPFFRRMEAYQGGEGDDRLRGRDGPIPVTNPKPREPIFQALIKAAAEIGIAHNPDYNGATQDGIAMSQASISRGWRMSTARCYLDPIRKRANLHIETDALAEALLFDGTRCIGVRFSGREARAAREVVVCGGTINSPQLLELSGIGQPERLAALGIAVRQALPGVGENLRDHYAPRTRWQVGAKGYTYNDTARGLRMVHQALRFAFLSRGLLASVGAPLRAFVRSREGLAAPDLLLGWVMMLTEPGPRGPRISRQSGMTCYAHPMRPESRGTVHITSADARQPPSIRFNFLSAPVDAELTVRAIRIARSIMHAPAMAPLKLSELSPGPAAQGDDEILDWVRRTAETTYHPVGTCRMGHDALAVVDDRLRVHGIERLRIADASIMPTLTSGNTNAPAIMIGEKAADMVLADAR